MRGSAVVAVAAWLFVLAMAARAPAQSRPPLRRDEDVSVTRGTDIERSQVAERSMARLPVGSVRLSKATPALELPEPAPTTASPREGAQMLQVPLALENAVGSGGGGATASQLRVSGGDGRIVTDERGAVLLALPAGSHAIVASKQSKEIAQRSVIREDERTPLPWLMVESRRSGAGVEVRSARPFLTLARAIRWDAPSGRHVAEFLLGLESEGGGRSGADLEHPMAARFVVSCDAVDPALAELGAIGPRGYRTVRVSCSPAVKNERERHFLEVRAERGSLRYPFDFPRRPGVPRLELGAATVPGLGFGAVGVLVRRVEEDGSPLPAERDLPVLLQADGGQFDAEGVVLPAGQTSVRAILHPRGLADIGLSAVMDGRRSETVMLDVEWPLFPLAAMVAGGALGGFVSALRRKRGDTGRQRRRTLEGVFVGTLVACLTLILPLVSTLSEWVSGTELGLFVLAGVAGFAGTPLLDRLVGTLFPSLRGADGAGPA